LRVLPRSATLCKVIIASFSDIQWVPIFRSKFNVALGIEAQGFCVLK